MMRLIALTFLALIIGLNSSPATHAEDRGHYNLSAKLAKWEQPVRYSVEVRSEMSGQMMIAIDQRWQFDMRVKLTRESYADDGSGVVSLVHERIRVDLGGDQPVSGSFDSADPAADAESTLGKVVTPLIDKPLTVTIASSGKITSVRGLNAIAPADPLAGALFQTLFTEAEFRRMYQPLFALKQEPPTAEMDEEWAFTTEESKGIDLVRLNHRLRIDSVRGDEVKVSIEGDAAMGEPGGLVKTDESSVEGTAYWDTAAAQLDRFETESSLKASSAPMNVSINLESATKLKRLKGDGGGAGRR